jgi:hypothetical protein
MVRKFCCKKKSRIERPKKIAITCTKRCKHFGCFNSFLYCSYRLIRVGFVFLWFYYLPILVIVISNGTPVWIYWTNIKGCD